MCSWRLLLRLGRFDSLARDPAKEIVLIVGDTPVQIVSSVSAYGGVSNDLVSNSGANGFGRRRCQGHVRDWCTEIKVTRALPVVGCCRDWCTKIETFAGALPIVSCC
jgi:hypothetical protein